VTLWGEPGGDATTLRVVTPAWPALVPWAEVPTHRLPDGAPRLPNIRVGGSNRLGEIHSDDPEAEELELLRRQRAQIELVRTYRRTLLSRHLWSVPAVSDGTVCGPVAGQ
jgi:hypothetical protein